MIIEDYLRLCRPIYAGAESGMSNTSTTRHDREPLRTLEVLPLK